MTNAKWADAYNEGYQASRARNAPLHTAPPQPPAAPAAQLLRRCPAHPQRLQDYVKGGNQGGHKLPQTNPSFTIVYVADARAQTLGSTFTV